MPPMWKERPHQAHVQVKTKRGTRDGRNRNREAKKHHARGNKKQVYHVDAREDNSESEETKSDTDWELGLYSLHQKERYSRISVLPLINGKEVEMELDMGAAVSLILWELYVLSQLPLQPTDEMLKTYTGEPLAPDGVIQVQVKLNSVRSCLYILCVL